MYYISNQLDDTATHQVPTPVEPFETLRYAVDDGVATLTLHRPDHGNAWTIRMAVELDAVLRIVDGDDDVRVLVVTGAGSVFSVGADLDTGSILRPGDESIEPPERPLLPSRVGKPVIAAMNGHAVGAGISFAMHCDLRLLADRAKVGFAFGRRGVIAEMGMHWVLPRVVGMATAMDFLVTGRNVDAAEALSAGLVHRVLATDDVVPEALRIARDIATYVAPLSAAVSKRLVWDAMDEPWDQAWAREQELFARLAGHPDAREGVESFLEKRPPRWVGRPSVDLQD
jgi:enoyl-CoA hydratase/carnithine racemase